MCNELAKEIAIELGGNYFVVSDPERPLYHAAAAVASDQKQAVRILKYVLQGKLK